MSRTEVKEYIELNGIKQVYIARKLGICKSKFSQYLSGKSNLTHSEKEMLSQITGIA